MKWLDEVPAYIVLGIIVIAFCTWWVAIGAMNSIQRAADCICEQRKVSP